MILFHVTPLRNFASIKRRGLLTAKSKGRLPVVWLHSRSRRDWATLHTVQRHGTREVAIFECAAPRSWITRSKVGLWYCDRDIPPGWIKKTVAVSEE